jgi:hypothetical protein
MDVAEAIAALKLERDRLDYVIGLLGGEARAPSQMKATRRFYRSADDKHRISQRMKELWSERKKKVGRKF